MKATVHLLLACVAAACCVLTWLAARSTVVVAPVLAGEPKTTSLEYSAPLLVLSLILATVAGVLVVVGIARLVGGDRGGSAA
ncbi:MAG TPA: hypothetical protein VJ777_08990 [Mycobacterium sp.]|nr:hypothetical protein [Mycobacterium sp.]